jgi:hypothetical protein
LRATLEAAQRSVDGGRQGTAATQLGAFVNQVEALVRADILTTEEADALLDAADSIIAQLD